MMAAIAIVEGIVLFLTVTLSGVFTELDAEAFRFFSNDATERAASLDGNTGRLIRSATNAATSLSGRAQELADAAGVPLQEVYLDDDACTQILEDCSSYLFEFLNGNAVSAAFFMLNGSNTHKTDGSAHSAVYIRDSSPAVTNPDSKNLQLEVGPLAIARENTMAVATGWAPDLQIPDGPEAAYYANPIEACTEYPRSELVRYGYWTPLAVIIPGTQAGISYTLPITDAKGKPCGVMGFEISLPFFISEYFSSTNLPYQGSFFAITSGTGDELDTSWIIPGSPTADAYLQPDSAIAIRPVSGTDVYETDIDGLGSMYCTVNELTMYSRNSPFADQRWLLTGMVAQSVLNETSTRISTLLLTTMAVTLGAAFVAIFLLTFLSTRKIAGLSQYVNELEPGSDIQFVRTDLREIDELTAAVESLNRRVNDSLKVTSKIMELSQLPLGGYEVSDDMDAVMVTEYITRLLHLKEGERVTRQQWSALFSELTSRPADGYPDVYRYDAGRLRSCAGSSTHSGIGQPEGELKWLRIIEAPTETGTVGMILDVTGDVDERMRLAHELDYDALTHLYNRNAFQREASRKISAAPDRVGAMIFADLDNLKGINDTYGHQAGDKLITTAADMFRLCREYGGVAARISGDEFAIFLHGYDSQEDIRGIIRKLYTDFNEANFETPDGRIHWIRCSSGVAWYPEDSQNVAELLKLSDGAMYGAKQSRKGTVVERNGRLLAAGDGPQAEGDQVPEEVSELVRMIDERRFSFDYQPVVSLHTGQIYGYETLISPQSSLYGTPAEMLAAAQAQHLLGPLESAMVAATLQVAQASLSALGGRKLFVSSVPWQGLSQREWDVLAIRYADVLPHLIMEISEAENDDLETMVAKLRELRRFNIPVAIDHFGQGFSNELRMIAMRPAIVKLEGGLVQQLSADEERQGAVRDLVAFAHAQGVRVAAEGIETDAELECAVRFGMDYAQGPLLGQPQPGLQKLAEHTGDMLRRLTDPGAAGQSSGA